MMPLYAYPQLGSTSDEAARLLGESHAVPFAVTALTQTKGRGRRGHTWQSAEGGLYLTFGLPWLTGLSLGAHSVASACVLALWLEECFGLVVQLKWPNDLLYEGAKLAGLLCESFLQGSTRSALSLGIGLNVHNRVGMSHTWEGRPAVSLSQVCLEPLGEIGFLVREFVGWWEGAWGRAAFWSFKDLEAHYSRFAWQRGVPRWQDAEGRVYPEASLQEDGGLQLHQGGCLQSASHALSFLGPEGAWGAHEP